MYFVDNMLIMTITLMTLIKMTITIKRRLRDDTEHMMVVIMNVMAIAIVI